MIENFFLFSHLKRKIIWLFYQESRIVEISRRIEKISSTKEITPWTLTIYHIAPLNQKPIRKVIEIWIIFLLQAKKNDWKSANKIYTNGHWKKSFGIERKRERENEKKNTSTNKKNKPPNPITADRLGGNWLCFRVIVFKF